MPDMRVIVVAINSAGVQYEGWLADDRAASDVLPLEIGANPNVQHTAIIDAAKAKMTEAHGVAFQQSDKIELWCGRAV